MKKTREIPKVYGKGFIISYILKRASKLTHPLHCLLKEILSLTPRTFQNTSTIFYLNRSRSTKNFAPTRKGFLDYLKAPNTDRFYMSMLDEISDLIKTLKNSKSLGSNSIPTNILKESQETISIPLSTLINKSFTIGAFPNMCKIAKIVPIFQSKTRLLCNNYRPISLLCNIGKIIEKLIHLRLNLFLETRNCYYLFRFGFRLNFSTNNALMSIIENIQTQFDDGKYSSLPNRCVAQNKHGGGKDEPFSISVVSGISMLV